MCFISLDIYYLHSCKESAGWQDYHDCALLLHLTLCVCATVRQLSIGSCDIVSMQSMDMHVSLCVSLSVYAPLTH